MAVELAETGFIDVQAHFMPPVDPAQRAALESGYRFGLLASLPLNEP
jgi:hypothetical protein